MTLRDFECLACGLVTQDHSRETCVCERCGAGMLRKPSAPALSFKGSGWTGKFYKDKS